MDNGGKISQCPCLRLTIRAYDKIAEIPHSNAYRRLVHQFKSLYHGYVIKINHKIY